MTVRDDGPTDWGGPGERAAPAGSSSTPSAIYMEGAVEDQSKNGCKTEHWDGQRPLLETFAALLGQTCSCAVMAVGSYSPVAGPVTLNHVLHICDCDWGGGLAHSLCYCAGVGRRLWSVLLKQLQSDGAVGVDCLLIASLDATIQLEFRLDFENS